MAKKSNLSYLINRHSPTETIMVGNSMGGFAAILFAALIGGVRAVAFSPLTFIDPWNRLSKRDTRWQLQICKLYARCLFLGKHYDLKKLSVMDSWSAEIHVSRADRLDMVHAQHVEQLRQVTVHKYEQGGHKLVRYLRDEGELPRILFGGSKKGLSDRGSK